MPPLSERQHGRRTPQCATIALSHGQRFRSRGGLAAPRHLRLSDSGRRRAPPRHGHDGAAPPRHRARRRASRRRLPPPPPPPPPPPAPSRCAPPPPPLLILIFFAFALTLSLVKYELTSLLYVSLGITAYMAMYPLLGMVITAWMAVVIAIGSRILAMARIGPVTISMEDPPLEFIKAFGLFGTYGIPVVAASA